MPARSAQNDTALRKAEVIYFLQEFGPLTTRQLAQLCGVQLAAMNQWLLKEQNTNRTWVRMPNFTWLLIEEEPVEPQFSPLPEWVAPVKQRKRNQVV